MSLVVKKRTGRTWYYADSCSYPQPFADECLVDAIARYPQFEWRLIVTGSEDLKPAPRDISKAWAA